MRQHIHTWAADGRTRIANRAPALGLTLSGSSEEATSARSSSPAAWTKAEHGRHPPKPDGCACVCCGPGGSSQQQQQPKCSAATGLTARLPSASLTRVATLMLMRPPPPAGHVRQASVRASLTTVDHPRVGPVCGPRDAPDPKFFTHRQHGGRYGAPAAPYVFWPRMQSTENCQHRGGVKTATRQRGVGYSPCCARCDEPPHLAAATA